MAVKSDDLCTCSVCKCLQSPPHKRHGFRILTHRDFDYSQNGAYFITIVTQGRGCLFGKVVNGEMVLNEAGRLVEQVCLEMPQHFHDVNVDTFVIMPIHIHGIIVIERDERPIIQGAGSPAHRPEQGETDGSIRKDLDLFPF